MKIAATAIMRGDAALMLLPLFGTVVGLVVALVEVVETLVRMVVCCAPAVVVPADVVSTTKVDLEVGL